MRLAVVGAGGVGGLLAGLAARAGLEVALLARGAALATIRAEGLHVTSGKDQFTVRPAAVSDDPAALGPCDAVMVAVKSWQVAELAPRLRAAGRRRAAWWSRCRTASRRRAAGGRAARGAASPTA